MATIRSLIVRVGANLTEFEKGMRKMESTLKKTGKSLQTIGRDMTRYITLPLIAAGVAATKLAIDAVESENLFEVSMKNMADSARAWSEELRDQLGLNSYEIRKNVGIMNVMIRSMGLNQMAAYDMATGITKLAYDMASFYNLPTDEAFEKLRSGLVGEIKPLKDLGILVDETTTKNYAYTHGIAKQGEVLTQQQKLLARYGAILEQTTDAQGDLARTIESPANQWRILKANYQQMGIELGEKLIPIFEKLMKHLQKLADWFSNLSDEQQDNIIKAAMWVAALGPILSLLGKLSTGISKTIKFVGQLGTAMKHVGSNTSTLGKGIDKLASWFGKLATAVTGAKVSLLAFGGIAAEAAGLALLQGSADPKVEAWKKNKAMSDWTDDQWAKYYDLLSPNKDWTEWENSLLPSVKQKAEAAKIIYDQMKETEDFWEDQEDGADAAADALERFRDSIRDVVDALRDQTQEFANFTSLFDIFERKYISGNRLMNRLKAQVKAMQEWQTGLVTLQIKGVSEQFLQVLRMMGPGAVDQINALAKMSPDFLRQYEDLYNQKLGIGGEQAKWANQAETYIETQINLEITGNNITGEEDAQAVADAIMGKLRFAGLRI